MMSPQAALIYTMVMVSAADSDMTDPELRMITDIIDHLPVFKDYDVNMLPDVASSCAEMLDQDDGLDQAIGAIKASLPPHLRETAYALACDIAAADELVTEEEMRLLELLRHQLELDRLIAAGIERGARARFSPLER